MKGTETVEANFRAMTWLCNEDSNRRAFKRDPKVALGASEKCDRVCAFTCMLKSCKWAAKLPSNLHARVVSGTSDIVPYFLIDACITNQCKLRCRVVHVIPSMRYQFR